MKMIYLRTLSTCFKTGCFNISEKMSNDAVKIKGAILISANLMNDAEHTAYYK